MSNKRYSNFELLRIIAMFMIVLIHANMNLGSFATGWAARIYNGMANGISNIGVSMFILISGYFGVSFNVKKLTKLELKMIVYSIFALVASLVFYGATMSMGDKLELFAKALLPFTSRSHWFYSCYVLVVIFSGYIDKFIKCLDEKKMRHFIMIMLFCFSVLPTCFYFEIVPDNGKGIVQMFMLYMIGRYIRLYADDFADGRKGLLKLALFGGWMINCISFLFPVRVGGIYHTLCKDNSITNLIMAVSLFYLFKEIKIESKIINRAAGCLFAVFAMNNTVISIYVDTISSHMPVLMNLGSIGFVMIPLISAAVLVSCVLVGLVCDLLLGGAYETIAIAAERAYEEFIRKLEEKAGSGECR